MCPAF